ncbi:MAG: hypothetical protein LBG52_01215 [Candidatus Peribacteria bacterium]|jgi:hypothetical protein|nr:hypothetical protein [Candidatus Peribacteria bacterium]
MDYGRDYDFSQPFTENFRKLILEVPRVCLNNQYTTLENAKYNNNAQYLKDCYFTF